MDKPENTKTLDASLNIALALSSLQLPQIDSGTESCISGPLLSSEDNGSCRNGGHMLLSRTEDTTNGSVKLEPFGGHLAPASLYHWPAVDSPLQQCVCAFTDCAWPMQGSSVKSLS